MATARVFAVILAAGCSRRFGAPKQLQPYHNKPLVRRAVRLAESVCGERCLLVTGEDWRAVLDAAGPLNGFFVRNVGYRSGMASSIAAGVRSVGNAADALLLILADQPLITKEHLKLLIDTWGGSPDAIVGTAFSNTVGPPTVFPARYFDRLSALRGDHGAREIITRHSHEVRQVNFEPAAVDIDRPDDLKRLS